MEKISLADAAALDVKLALMKFGKIEATRIAKLWQRNIGADAVKLVEDACAKTDAMGI